MTSKGSKNQYAPKQVVHHDHCLGLKVMLSRNECHHDTGQLSLYTTFKHWQFSDASTLLSCTHAYLQKEISNAVALHTIGASQGYSQERD